MFYLVEIFGQLIDDRRSREIVKAHYILPPYLHTLLSSIYIFRLYSSRKKYEKSCILFISIQ